MRKLPILLLAILSGCAAPRRYADPAGDLGAHARVSIRNVSRVPLRTRLYDDPADCSAPVVFAGEALRTGEARAVWARKGAPLTIGAWYRYELGPGYGRECGLNVSFVPRDASYRVTFESDGLGKTCQVAVEEDGASPRAIPPERLVVRRSRPFTDRKGPFCEPLDEGQAAALGAP